MWFGIEVSEIFVTRDAVHGADGFSSKA
jgi:hypothetical protein